MIEEWRDVQGYEGIYKISSHGRLKSLDRTIYCKNGKKQTIKGKIRKLKLDYKGYNVITLNKNNISKPAKIHRLVAMTFIENCENKPQVNHKDGNKNNNKAENLEWVTCSENIKHAFKKGLNNNCGENNSTSKLTGMEVMQIREFSKSVKQCELAIKYNVTSQNISDIVNYKTWKHIGTEVSS